MQQRIVAAVATGEPVPLDEPAVERLDPEPDQVHDEKGDVGGDVDPSQVRVELDAVIDVDLARRRGDHVLGAQVAVTVAHQPRRGPTRELIAPGGYEGAGVALGGIET